MKRRRKRPLTLIELLISMMLMSMLVIALFTFYSDIVWSSTAIEKTREEAFELRYCQSRLSDVLMRTTRLGRNNTAFFTSYEVRGFTQGKSLIFCYHNGIAYDYLFSTEVIGRLYLNSDNELCLATWPDPSKTKGITNPTMQKEVLLRGVRSLDFSFFVPLKDEEEGKVDPNAPTSEVLDSWELQYSRLPTVVRIKVELASRPGEIVEFAYPLARAMEPIQL